MTRLMIALAAVALLALFLLPYLRLAMQGYQL